MHIRETHSYLLRAAKTALSYDQALKKVSLESL